MASHHLQSSGRGGAGNIVDSSLSPKLQAKDLETPTLKTSMVTTGRGGSGNMAKNTDPVETRARQDVEPVTRRPSHGATHIGRGGNGNVFKGDEAQAARDAARKGDSGVISDDEEKRRSRSRSPGWAEKSKQFLGLGHNKRPSKDGHNNKS
ncbi:hypothetical protein DL546_002176 [Coniochaeta pulveracea]|uniref:Uncharacterized protein n=1 Tax=Coniochaeta pulveracea TaxID=177199 RepID=A0A420Y4G0_9PEZI|nr:hypothetical protein DL546_002176 [Coniochaeta pulveracea]